MTQRRNVRVAESFFTDLDALLPPDRGSDGTPSASDFLAYELPTIIERVAHEFDRLPLIVDGLTSAPFRCSELGLRGDARSTAAATLLGKRTPPIDDLRS